MGKWGHRQSKCTLTLRDAQGNIMPGRKVRVELKNHEFLFGCGVFWLAELLDPATPPEYRALLEKYWKRGANCLITARCPSIRATTNPARASPIRKRYCARQNI